MPAIQRPAVPTTSAEINKLQERILESMTEAQKHTLWKRLDRLIVKYKFEMKGRSNVVAIGPTFITKANYLEAAAATTHIHSALQKLLQAFKKEKDSGPLHNYFRPYERFYDLIHSEVRNLNEILHMRADYSSIGDPSKRKSFEPNTACPGSFIDYPVINNAWESFAIEQGWINMTDVYRPPMLSEVAFFARKLVEIAKRVNPNRAPNVLLGNYHGVYKSELEGLIMRFAELPEKDRAGGKIFFGDVRDLAEKGGYFYFQGEPISLIFNKLDPLVVSESKADLATWFKAAKSPHIEFLNSMGAMFLTETKRSFGAITDPEIQQALGLDKQVIASIAKYVPETIPLHKASAAKIREIEQQKDLWILKPDALTRGDGVRLGLELTDMEWKEVLATADKQDSILQREAQTQKHHTVIYDPKENAFRTLECFHGMDIFVVDGEAVGYSSRCRDNRVINVGAGGYAAPLVVLG